ncbi:MAG: hypothetical protein HY291_09490 [Planctomycetes bacterium]|nr:hypothetical protein [Planctomycetota bacterium]
MSMKRAIAGLVSVVLLVCVAGVQKAHAESREDFDKLKKEVEELKKLADERKPGVAPNVADKAQSATDEKYGHNQVVTTRQGKLTIGGLLQVWYYHIANDNNSWAANDGFSRPARVGSNEANDNDSYRIRRAELKFTMDISENVTGVIMIDPAREATSFPSLPATQTSTISGDGVAFFNDAGLGLNSVRNGSGNANRLLQDAYINVHGVLPHHDVTTGQFKRHLGEEGTRDSAQLDFVERAMITQLADLRDLGMQLHGTWWDDRFQYWLGMFDGAGSAFQQHQNRANDNDAKDYVASLMLRPLWKNETWGSIELGYSIMYGKGGEGGGHYTGSYSGLFETDGLNQNKTIHSLQYAYLAYMPGGPVKGLWIRGEWGQYRDRFAPGAVSVGVNSLTAIPFTSTSIVNSPAPFQIYGWTASTGYKLSDSIWSDHLKNGNMVEKILADMEFVARYEEMQNLFYPKLVPQVDPAAPLPSIANLPLIRDSDVFKTQIATVGFNYYFKGNNVKLQVNYSIVNEQNDGKNQNRSFTVNGMNTSRRFVREVENNNLVVNFQVAW